MLSKVVHWIERRTRGARPRSRQRRRLPPCLDLLETRELLSTTIPLNSSSWTQLGPTTGVTSGVGGAGALASSITSIATDPSDINHVIIGTAGGGVFDGRISQVPNPGLPATVSVQWTPLTANVDIPGTSVIGTVALDPNNSQVIYAGTGEANYRKDSFPGRGILKSTDGGQNWVLLEGDLAATPNVIETSFAGYSISKVFVDWANSNYVFAAVSRAGTMGATGNTGIYRSLDGGQTWTNLTIGDPLLTGSGRLAFTDLIIDPQSENLFFGIGDVTEVRQQVAATLVLGGSGYNVNDRLIIQGGPFIVPIQLSVITVNASGAITAVGIDDNGMHRALLDAPSATVRESVDSASAGPITLTNVTNPAGRGVAFDLSITSSNPSPFLLGHALNGVYVSPDATNPLVAPTFRRAGATVAPVPAPSPNDLLTGLNIGRISLATGWRGASSVDWASIQILASGAGANPLTSLSTVTVGRTGNGVTGTGHRVGDELILDGGTFIRPARLRVVATDIAPGSTGQGEINRVAIIDPGIYTTPPPSPTTARNITTLSARGAEFLVFFPTPSTSPVQVASVANGGNVPGRLPGDAQWRDEVVSSQLPAALANFLSDGYSGSFQGANLTFDAGNYTNAVAVHPLNPTVAALGGGRVNTNGGDTDILTNANVLGGSSGRFAAIPSVNSLAGVPNPDPATATRNVGDFTHALAYDRVGNLFVATDTGLWLFNMGGTNGVGPTDSNQAGSIVTGGGGGGGGPTTNTQGVWTNLNGNLPNGQFNSVALVPGSDDTVFTGARGLGVAAFADGTSHLLPVLAPAGFTGWVADNPAVRNPSPFSSDNFTSTGRVIVDPRDPRNVYAVTTGPLDHGQGVFFFRSRDGGVTWEESTQQVGNGLGLGRADSRSPLLPLVFNLPAGQVAGVTIQQGGAGYRVGDLLNVLGGSFTSPAQLRVTSINSFGAITGVAIVSGGRYISAGAGPFSASNATTPGASGALFQLRLSEARLLLGTDRLYASDAPEGQTNSWRVLNNSRPSAFAAATPLAIGDITAIAAGPNRGVSGQQSLAANNTIYIGVGHALLASFDDGNTWINVTPASAGASAVFTSIVVDPTNPDIVFVVSPNASRSGGGKIWRSTTGGRGGWTETSVNLPARTNIWSVELVPMTATVASGGSGYRVGDVLSVPDASATSPAQLVVTAVAAEPVTTVVNGGAGYQVGDLLTAQGGTPYQGVSAAAIGAGGQGHRVGDLLTVVGGTFARPAQLVVTSVGAGGAVSGVSINDPGAYTELPAGPITLTSSLNPAATDASFTLTFAGRRLQLRVAAVGAQGEVTSVTVVSRGDYFGAPGFPVVMGGGTGAGASVNPSGAVFLNVGSGYQVGDLLTAQGGIPHQRVASAAIAAGGVGHQVGDVLTIVGGSFSRPAQLVVGAVDQVGAVTSVSVSDPGLYTSLPQSPVVGTSSTNTGATSASFNLAFRAGVLTVQVTSVNAFGNITGSTLIERGDYQSSPGNPIVMGGGNGAGATLNSVGRITGVSVINQGNYAARPANPAAAVNTDAASTGAGALVILSPEILLAGTDAGVYYTPFPLSNINWTVLGATPVINTTTPGSANATFALGVNAAGQVSSAAVVTSGSGYRTGDLLTSVDSSSTIPARLQVAAITTTGASVAAGGNGYRVGDVLTVTGGTATAATQLTVTAITPSQVAIVGAGNGYAVGDVLTVAGGTFSSATQIRVDAIAISQVSVAEAGGGSGYTVGDVLTVAGGNFSTAAQLTVTSVDAAGAITGVALTLVGAYLQGPTGRVAVTGGTGSGAAFDITFAITSITLTQAGSYSESPASPVSVTGGSGSGATFSLSGAVAAAAVTRSGAYTQNPANPAVVTGGSGAGATFNLSGAVAAVTIADGGRYTGLMTGGLPNAQVRDLQYDPATDTLAAATYGLGLHQLKLTGSPAPVITVPVNVIVGQNANFFDFQNTISVGAPAVLDQAIRVRLTLGDRDALPAAVPAHGRLTFGRLPAGVRLIQGTGTGDTTLEFEGTVNAVNAVLASLRYVPDVGYVGGDRLTITVDDLENGGHRGLGTRHIVSRATDIDIVPISLSTSTTPVNITADDTVPDIVVNVSVPAGQPPALLPVTLDFGRSATIAQAGTGYTIDDIVTVQGGTTTTPAQLRVTAVDGAGGITSAVFTQIGSYAQLPTNPVPVTGGTGTGASFVLTTLAPAGVNFTPVTVQAVNGVATFSGIELPVAGSYVFAAYAASVSVVNTGVITVAPGVARSLVIDGGPATAIAGQAFSVTVERHDQHGNVVATTQPVTIDLSILEDAASPTLTLQTVTGRVTFNGLVLNTTGVFTIRADERLPVPPPPPPGLPPPPPPVPLNAGTLRFTITPAADDSIQITVPQVATAGQPIPPITVTVLDIFGNVKTDSTAQITLAVATGPAQFSAGSVTALVPQNGQAVFTALQLDSVGSYTFTAASTAPNVTPIGSGPLSVVAAGGARLAFQSSLTSVAAGTLPTFRVNVLDSFGNLADGTTVDVTITATGPTGNGGAPGDASGTTTVTTSAGVATFDAVRLTRPGTYTLTATVAGLTSTFSNTFVVSAGPASTVAFGFPAGFPTRFAAGAALPPFQVLLSDAFGNLAAGMAPVTLSATGGPGTLNGQTSVNAVNGVATFSGLSFSAAGSYTLTAQSGTLPAATSTVEVEVPVATALGFAASIADGSAGQALPTFRVNILDQFGNAFSGAASTAVTVAGTTVQTVSGVATFSGIAVTTSGSQSFTATAAGLTSATSNNFNIAAGPAAAMAFAGLGNTTAGTIPSVTVNLLDAFGNIATGSSATVALTAAGPGAIGGTTSGQAAGGVATFADLSLPRAGSYTLTAGAQGLPPVTSQAFTISAAAAAQLAFRPLNATITAGQALPDFQVEVLDAFGNAVTGTQLVSVASAIAGGGITGTTSVQAVNGVATFRGVGLTTAGNYALVAAAAGLTSGSSAAVTVNPAAAVGLRFEPVAASLAAGEALMNVKVSVVDSFGNVVTGNNALVSLTSSGPGPLGGGSTSAPAVNGVANFLFLSFTRPGSYTLTASAAGLNAASSSALTVTPGAPARLVWINVPSGGQAGQTLPALQIQAYDAFGNLILNSDTPITVQASSGGLTGTASATIVNGIATFTGLALMNAGSVTLTAQAGGRASVTTAPFTVTAPPRTATTTAIPTRVRFLSATTRARPGRSLGVVRIQLLDRSGRPVRKGRVLVTVRLAGRGRLTGLLRVFTDSRGIATFTNLRISTGGRFLLIATAARVPVKASRLITVTAIRRL